LFEELFFSGSRKFRFQSFLKSLASTADRIRVGHLGFSRLKLACPLLFSFSEPTDSQQLYSSEAVLKDSLLFSPFAPLLHFQISSIMFNNMLEGATGMDLNGDGRVGGRYGRPTVGTQMENMTGMDLNGDGMVGGLYGRPTMNTQMEFATGMDLNGDGRVGGRYGYYGGPQMGMGYAQVAPVMPMAPVAPYGVAPYGVAAAPMYAPAPMAPGYAPGYGAPAYPPQGACYPGAYRPY
jgi:hypothetical protein